jgi:predicted site-specific integrase-resolvase
MKKQRVTDEITIADAAAFLGLDKSNLCRYVREGRLGTFRRVGERVILLRTAAVVEFKKKPRGRPRKER